ncbi:MAG: elongation factor P [Bryobacteraceae bacterium]|jgi:elongation factor P
MVAASQLRAGMAVRFEGQPYRVLVADYHPGQGKMGGVTHARLKNLSTGTLWEHSFRSDLKLEELDVEKQPMDYLYDDAGECYFMNPETFEQIAIPRATVGPQAALLLPQMRVAVEFVEGRPVSVSFPDVLEVRVAETAPPVHQQVDSVWKPARLESGVEIMVPQFIKKGDLVRLDVANMKYMDRAKGTGKS